MFCGNCGNKIGAGSAFCANCGKQVGGQVQAKPAAINSAASGALKKKKIIVVAALACIVCVVVILIVNSGGGELDGIWENTPSRFEPAMTVEFSGNRFTWTETGEVIDSLVLTTVIRGTFSINDDRIELVTRSIEYDIESFPPHFTAQQRRETRELVLEYQVAAAMEETIEVFSFSRTENTFTMDGIRYTRVISGDS